MTTSPSILSRILEWSSGIPLWQRDALRRITTSDSITEADIKELTELCKKNAQQKQFPEASPLSSKHVPQQGVGEQSVSLVSMKNLSGVNRLPSDQTLRFSGAPGITLVYGDNGTGKSSYARVLKRACRSRGSSSPILHDIYSSKPKNPASADIEFKIDTEILTCNWVDQQETEPLLTNVFVFDTHAALHYVRQNDKTAFTPFGLDILKKLADIADEVGTTLKSSKLGVQSKKADLKSKWKFTANTQVYRLIEGLSHSTEESSIKSFSVLSEEESKRHVTLKETLKADPIKKARETRARADRIKDLSKTLKFVSERLSSEQVQEIKTKISDLQSNRTKLKEFKEQFFDSGYITGTGGFSWIKLWNAAKEFSENDAYPGSTFPKKDERCVLCQQDLDVSAQGRFESFKAFIENKLQADIEKLKEALDERRSMFEKIAKAVVLFASAKADLEAEASDDVPEIESIAMKADTAIAEACKALKDSIDTIKHFSAKAISNNLDAIVSTLEERAKTEESASDPEKRKSLEDEYNELNDRITLSEVSSSVIEYVTLSKEEKLLDEAIKRTRTNAITKKNRELIKSAVTEPFCKRFADEIIGLELESIKVKMVEYPDPKKKGDLTFGIELENTSSGKPVDIASEGEQRCLAIAAFFAELAQANHHSALVFDDPVSSLDIYYRENIAKRLVKEAKQRQVVVFTHDSFFLNQLLALLENEKVASLACYVEWDNGCPGVIREGVPWDCQKPEERIKELDSMLRRLKETWNPVPSETNKSDIRKAYSKLRDTLERIVESIVFNGAIERFNRYIDLKRLRSRVNLEEADENELHRIFDKCSGITEAHDNPRAAQGATARPTDFEHDLKDTKTLIQTLRGKKRKTKR